MPGFLLPLAATCICIHSTDVPCSCAVGKRCFKLESGCCLGHMRLSRFVLDLAGQLCKYFSKIPGIGSSSWYVPCCPHILSHPIPSPEGMRIGPSLPPSGSERLYWEDSAAKLPRVYPQVDAAQAQVEKKNPIHCFQSVLMRGQIDCAVDSNQLCRKQWLRQLKK